MGVHWGRPQPLGPDTLSSFKEVWLLEWQPEFSLLLIERASYGNTVAAAAGKFAAEQAAEIKPPNPSPSLPSIASAPACPTWCRS